MFIYVYLCLSSLETRYSNLYAMYLTTCNAPNGPLQVGHRCLGLGRQVADGMSLLAKGEQIEQMEQRHQGPVFWKLLAFVGWCAFFLVLVALMCAWKDMQSQRRKQNLGWRLGWRLARRANDLMADLENQMEQLQDLRFRRKEEREAAACGQTMFFDSADVDGQVATLCQDTMFRRMDIPTPQDHMQWNFNGNRAIFAMRAWGAVVWRKLCNGVGEILACGSCGLHVGAGMCEWMHDLVVREGFTYLVLKAMGGSEHFWEEQGFLPLSNQENIGWNITWWGGCGRQVQKLLREYAAEARPLMPFAKQIPQDGRAAIPAVPV